MESANVSVCQQSTRHINYSMAYNSFNETDTCYKYSLASTFITWKFLTRYIHDILTKIV